MKWPHRHAAARLAAAWRAGRDLAFFFDFDGTLSPTVDDPVDAALSAIAREALRSLVGLERITVGVISGRALDDLCDKIDLPGVDLAGTSGLEILCRGERHVHPASIEHSPSVVVAADQLTETLADFTGVWFERKPLGITIHTRSVDAASRTCVHQHVRQKLSTDFPTLRVVETACGVEITAAIGVTKADAVRELIRSRRIPRWLPFAAERVTVAGESATPVPLESDPIIFYAGDEANDAEAIAYVNAKDGITFGIGPHAPAASQFRLDIPAMLCRWLTKLLSDLVQQTH